MRSPHNRIYVMWDDGFLWHCFHGVALKKCQEMSNELTMKVGEELPPDEQKELFPQ